MVLLGSWATHPKYGPSVRVDGMEHDFRTRSGGADPLSGQPSGDQGHWSGQGQIDRRVSATPLKKPFWNDPERIALKARLPMDAARRLRDEWLKNRSVNTVMAWLSAFGLTHHQVTTLVEKLGGNCLDI